MKKFDIEVLEPHGFCSGVTYALDKLNKEINITDPTSITVLGQIIHNDEIVNSYKNKGLNTIDIPSHKRLDMLKDVKTSKIAITAHGASPAVYTTAKSLGLEIIDCTCPFVKKIHSNILNKLNDDYTVLYIGKKKHPECEGVLGISEKIHLVDSIDNIPDVKNDKIYVTNQTTLSILDIEHIINKIKGKYPYAKIDNKICMATTKRQNAVLNQRKADLTIIIGGKSSSNTNKLFLLSSKINKTILIQTYNDLLNYSFDNIESINISSGASTPKYLLDEVISYLNEYQH